MHIGKQEVTFKNEEGDLMGHMLAPRTLVKNYSPQVEKWFGGVGEKYPSCKHIEVECPIAGKVTNLGLATGRHRVCAPVTSTDDSQRSDPTDRADEHCSASA